MITPELSTSLSFRIDGRDTHVALSGINGRIMVKTHPRDGGREPEPHG
jgi:hypothetical protein